MVAIQNLWLRSCKKYPPELEKSLQLPAAKSEQQTHAKSFSLSTSRSSYFKLTCLLFYTSLTNLIASRAVAIVRFDSWLWRKLRQAPCWGPVWYARHCSSDIALNCWHSSFLRDSLSLTFRMPICWIEEQYSEWLRICRTTRMLKHLHATVRICAYSCQILLETICKRHTTCW